MCCGESTLGGAEERRADRRGSAQAGSIARSNVEQRTAPQQRHFTTLHARLRCRNSSNAFDDARPGHPYAVAGTTTFVCWH
eukprot:3428385-Pleurochrysis_carterae.AAC.1